MLRRIGSSHICAGGPATGAAPLALAAVLGGEGPARAPGQADDGRPEAAAILRTTGIEALSRLDGQPLSHWQRLAVAELLAGLPADTAGRIRQLVCVTQTPDRLIPTAAAVLRPALAPLGVAPAHQVDLASGCSGYADGLRLLEALLGAEASAAPLGLLICGDLSSRLIDRHDHALAAVFGDAVSADLLELSDDDDAAASGGWQQVFAPAAWGALQRCEGEGLQMDGLEVMNFVFATVVPSLLGFLAGRLAGVDPGRRCLVLHQANRFIVSAVEKRVRAAHPGLRLCGFQLGHIGNPGSASIPIALELARRSGALVGVERAIVCGFGVGLSCHMGEIAL